MGFAENQKKEIATIKERTVSLRLSDADCTRIAEKAGRAGMTVGELLTQFVGDLVCGTYTNGSDERMYAQDWFDRCWFGAFPQDTLLKFLLDSKCDVEEFLAAYDELEHCKSHPEEYAEEAKADGEENLWFVEDYHYFVDEWIAYHEGEVVMAKEVELCRKWAFDYRRLRSKGRTQRYNKEKIRKLKASGKSYREVAEEIGCSKTYVIRVCNE